ncbi:MAG: pantetheine-phosphate adenylyltransferase [Actinobacteria bacterium]|nr:pantetheine-phosphate adenylyltransferase [Actinomycetota bacterium]
MIACCPGTYDPVTYGHLDIIERASRMFDEVVVSVTVGSRRKQPLFSAEERIRFVEMGVAHLPNVRVAALDQLVTVHAGELGASVLVKGLRAISDFDYEFQMAQINKHLSPECETIYLAASARFSFLSSSGVKEIAAWGGSVSDWVPPYVAAAFAERMAAEGLGTGARREEITGRGGTR